MFHTMGERTYLNRKRNKSAPNRGRTGEPNRYYQSLSGTLAIQSDPLESGNQTQVKHQAIHLKIDLPFLLAIIALIVFGMLMLYSASYDYSWLINEGDALHIFTRQLLWLGLGICGVVALTFINYHILTRFAVLSMLGTLILLGAVLFIGDVRNGAARTIYGGSIQPSELAKLVIIIYLAVWLSAKGERLTDKKFGLFPLAGILGIFGGMIALQPDLSALITVVFLGALMFFLAGGDLRQIGILLVVALVFGSIIVMLSPTGSARLQEYIEGLKDPIKGSYHIQRAFEAFVRGGWLGVGIGKAETKLTGLPVPPTDSIFAVIGEETGVIGSVALIGLYSLLLWRGLVIARKAPDKLGTLLAGGLSIWIASEAFLNMSVILNLLPFAGNTLPFISAGGSNLLVCLAAVGILLNISRLSVKKDEENGRLSNAVISLRRWNRRGRVSRPGRPSSDPQSK
jgi:cell division protein FtsW